MMIITTLLLQNLITGPAQTNCYTTFLFGCDTPQPDNVLPTEADCCSNGHLAYRVRGVESCVVCPGKWNITEFCTQLSHIALSCFSSIIITEIPRIDILSVCLTGKQAMEYASTSTTLLVQVDY